MGEGRGERERERERERDVNTSLELAHIYSCHINYRSYHTRIPVKLGLGIAVIN